MRGTDWRSGSCSPISTLRSGCLRGFRCGGSQGGERRSGCARRRFRHGLHSQEVVLRSRPNDCLRALLLQAFYTMRSERQLIEQLDYNLLYRRREEMMTTRSVNERVVVAKQNNAMAMLKQGAWHDDG